MTTTVNNRFQSIGTLDREVHEKIEDLALEHGEVSAWATCIVGVGLRVFVRASDGTQYTLNEHGRMIT